MYFYPIFEKYGKTPRLNRDCVITEKIDGTNGQILIAPLAELASHHHDNDVPTQEILPPLSVVETPNNTYNVYAGSRNRLVSTGKGDNAGFAAWVEANAEALVDRLGAGRWFGEWYGRGVQSGYGLDDKRFALFRPDLKGLVEYSGIPGLEVVHVIYEGPFSTDIVDLCVSNLREFGSQMYPGQKAEGVIVFHTASRQVYKVLCENDEIPKGLVV